MIHSWSFRGEASIRVIARLAAIKQRASHSDSALRFANVHVICIRKCE